MSYNVIKKEEAKKEVEEMKLPETEYTPKVDYDLTEVVSKVEEEGDYDLDQLKKEVMDIAQKEIELQRKKIIDQAKQEAEKIKEEAYQDAYKEGYEEGYTKAKTLGEEEAEKIKKQVINQYTEAEHYVDSYLKQNQENLVNLSIDMAESIINYSLDEDHDNIIKMLTPILRDYDKQSNIVISCSSERFASLEEQMKDLESKSPGSKIIILKDESLDKNDVVLETDYQILDMGIKKQLDTILTKINHME